MGLQIYNVLSGKKEPFSPIHEGEVRIYVCGVTVYGRSHVGHLRCYLSFDAIVRYLAYRGYAVKYVRNFTDIDDKIILRAREIEAGPEGDWRRGEAYAGYDEAKWQERIAEDREIRDAAAKAGGRHLAEVVADHFIRVFRDEDFGRFGLLQPLAEPRVSEHIPEVIALVEKIIGRGFAYAAEGDVYFDVPAYHAATGAYGKLSRRDYTELQEGARVSPGDKKRSGPDFALWKAAGPGEPAWDSPWGRGRPGWHIECSAMSVDALGQPFDIHGGGKDLIFPHHENEIAQSEAAAGTPFCRTWMHNGFVTVDGVKMSKSLGNFISIKDALAIAPPDVWRLLVLGAHYANPIDFSRTRELSGDRSGAVRGTIDIAFDRLEYFYETLSKADGILRREPVPEGAAPDPELSAKGVTALFEEAMDDDFNTARALAEIGEAMRALNEAADLRAKEIKKRPGGRDAWLAAIRQAAGEIRRALGVLGFPGSDPDQALAALRDFSVGRLGLDSREIEAKVAARDAARAAKDFAKSDQLRDELKALGVELRDTPSGTVWKVIR